jgi:hypothetical protein
VPRKVGLYPAIDRKLETVVGAEPPDLSRSDLASGDLTPLDLELLGALDSPAELVTMVFRAGDTWQARAKKLAELCRRTGRGPRYKNAESLKSAMSRAQKKGSKKPGTSRTQGRNRRRDAG